MSIHVVGTTSYKVISNLKKHLPSQAPLPFFVHHNPLHAWQHLKFDQAIDEANSTLGICGYMPLSFYKKEYTEGRILAQDLEKAYLKITGKPTTAADWEWLFTEQNPVQSLNQIMGRWQMERNFHLQKHSHAILFRWISAYLDQGISFSPFDQTHGFFNALLDLQKNSGMPLFKNLKNEDWKMGFNDLDALLARIVGPEEFFEPYLYNQQFAHPGWSGMVTYLEKNPEVFGRHIQISLQEFITVECLLELDLLIGKFGADFKPLMQDGSPILKTQKEYRLAPEFIWLTAMESALQDSMIEQLCTHASPLNQPVKFEAFFCIDDRECSIRRHLENSLPALRTWGTPGFFHLPLVYKKHPSATADKVCPLPMSPEIQADNKKEDASNGSNPFSEWWKLLSNAFLPQKINASVDSFDFSSEHIDFNLNPEQNPQYYADRIAQLFLTSGLTETKAKLIYLIGHGASSTNNPYYAGYDCGACSGRPGSVNATLAARLLNMPSIRIELKRKGIQLADELYFIGALHDTTRDRIRFFDTSSIPQNLRKLHLEFTAHFESALLKNAHERALLLDARKNTPAKSHQHIQSRAWALFEPRPEWNHARNAFCIVGPRSETKGLNLDRRAFLQSYDPRFDIEGNVLQQILQALVPVCGGINLEYYFSTVDPLRLGAGSKLPHNVVGLFGVANGVGGDLRTGLPEQMITKHQAVRLTCIIFQDPLIIQKVLDLNENLKNWFDKEWILLFAIHPNTREPSEFRRGTFNQNLSTDGNH